MKPHLLLKALKHLLGAPLPGVPRQTESAAVAAYRLQQEQQTPPQPKKEETK